MSLLDCRLTVKFDDQKNHLIEFRVVGLGHQTVAAAAGDDELTRLSVERLSRWIGNHRNSCQRDDLRALGLHLYHILFGGALKNEPGRFVHDIFEQTYKEFLEASERRGDRLRLTLVFAAENDPLAKYPWEFLFVPVPSPTQGVFLTGERTELILTRAVASPLVVRFEPELKGLKILVAVSKPRELDAPDEKARKEIDLLATNLEKLNMSPISVETLHNPTHAELKEKINTFKPHIVHIIAHGKPGGLALLKSKEAIAYEKVLVDENRKREIEETAWADANSVRALFSSNPPRIVFLHACSSASAPESLSSFQSLAEQVLFAKVPAVVAMQYEISNDDATRFATTFYGQLGEGKSIDEAVKEGRKALGEMEPSWGHPRFGTPVVYLQSDDLPIFTKEAVPTPADEKEKGVPTPTGLVPCPYDCGELLLADRLRCHCKRREPLKRCRHPQCLKAVRRDDPDCPFCGFVFPPEAPTLQKVLPAVPSAAATTGPKELKGP